MSKPTRYTQNIKCVEPSYLAQNIQSGMVECSIGEWVLHSDYARLKAEVERLESDNLKLKDDLERQIETRNYFIHKMMLKIKHVDLLTSSGDNLQNALLKLTSGTPDWNQEIFWNWNAAKEGKPSV